METELTFEDILARINAEGAFSASVLTSDDGLPVACMPVPSPYDADTIAAMVTLVKGYVSDMQARLGLAEVNEVSMVVDDRSRLVCRYFSAAGRGFVLTTIAPPGKSYRRLTTRAVREFTNALENYEVESPDGHEEPL